MTLEVFPDWPALILRLHKRIGSDDRIADRLAYQGVVLHRSALVYLRNRPGRIPGFNIGAALVNLYAETFPNDPIPPQKPHKRRLPLDPARAIGEFG